jgi:glycosyltransferase involved in cell wall biosynthesis
LSKNSTKVDAGRARVAVLVHNEVFKDARVRKETATLVAAGFEVDVFGITKVGSDHPPTVEGAKVELLTNKPSLRRGKLRSLVQKRTVQQALLLLCALVLGSAAYVADLSWSLRIAVLASLGAVFLLGCLKRSPAQKWRRITATRYMFAGFGAAATVSAVILNVLSVWDLVWVGLCTWGLLRVDPNPTRLKNWAAKLRAAAVRSTRESRYNFMASLLADRVLNGHYDIVHCHDIIALIAGGRIKSQKPDTLLIWDAHEIYEDMANGSDNEKLLVQSIIRSNQHLVDRFITINESIATFYRRNYSLPPASIVMNATRYNGEVDYDGRLHRAAGLNLDQKILIFQGGLAPYRGISTLLEAARDLPDGWSIVMMGWGNMQDAVDRAIAEIGDSFPAGRAPLSVIPPAPQEELAYWTAGATLGAILYEDVGLNHLYCTPNKLWEYPNAGVPIVATDLVEMSAMIEAWGIGVLLPRACKADDLNNVLRSVTDEKITYLKQRCSLFSREMSWQTFEDCILRQYSGATRNPASS